MMDCNRLIRKYQCIVNIVGISSIFFQYCCLDSIKCQYYCHLCNILPILLLNMQYIVTCIDLFSIYCPYYCHWINILSILLTFMQYIVNIVVLDSKNVNNNVIFAIYCQYDWLLCNILSINLAFIQYIVNIMFPSPFFTVLFQKMILIYCFSSFKSKIHHQTTYCSLPVLRMMKDMTVSWSKLVLTKIRFLFRVSWSDQSGSGSDWWFC